MNCIRPKLPTFERIEHRNLLFIGWMDTVSITHSNPATDTNCYRTRDLLVRISSLITRMDNVTSHMRDRLCWHLPFRMHFNWGKTVMFSSYSNIYIWVGFSSSSVTRCKNMFLIFYQHLIPNATPYAASFNSLWPGGLVKMGHFNTMLTSPKSWPSQEDLDAGCEHSLVPMDSRGF